MAQKRISFGGYDDVQPSKFEFSFATTMTEDSGRPQSGKAQLTPLFTVESYLVEFDGIKPAEAAKLLQVIIPKRKSPFFEMYHFSPYLGKWTTGSFYVGDGSLTVKSLEQKNELLESISFNAIGRTPIA